MLFVIDKPRMQRVISIVREDRGRPNDPEFMRIEASGGMLTIDGGGGVTGSIPATIYQEGVIFMRPTRFRRMLRHAAVGEKFVTFQWSEDGLRVGEITMPWAGAEMVLFPDVKTAPKTWPPEFPEREKIPPPKAEPTLFD